MPENFLNRRLTEPSAREDGLIENETDVEDVKENVATGLRLAKETKDIFLDLLNQLPAGKSLETEETSLVLGKVIRKLDEEAAFLRSYWGKIN